VACPEEQLFVLEIAYWRQCGWSLGAIAKELNRRGVATKRGGKWHTSTVAAILKRAPIEEPR